MSEDRVVSTEALRRMSAESDGELVVGAGLLDTLDPDGLHVLVPTGHVHGPGEPTLRCCVQLATVGTDEPVEAEVLVAAETFEHLPTAFKVLRVASSFVPTVIATVDEDLAELLDAPTGEEPEIP
jgi:hypothetical protein